MLVLLVVFMVTTPIIVEQVTQRKVEVNLPTTNARPVKPDELQTLLILHKNFKVGLDLGQAETEIATCDPRRLHGLVWRASNQSCGESATPRRSTGVFNGRPGFPIDLCGYHGAPQRGGYHQPRQVTNPPPEVGRP